MLRFIVFAAATAVSFAIPVFAENVAPDPNAQEAAQKFVNTFNSAAQNKDAAALAALYTEDAYLVTPDGTVSGRAAIERWRAEGFKVITAKPSILERVDMIGTAVRVKSGTWAVTLENPSGPIQLKGYWSTTDVFDGRTWRIRMETFNVVPPAASSASN